MSLSLSSLERLFDAVLFEVDDPLLREQIRAVQIGSDSISLPDELMNEEQEVKENQENLCAIIKEMNVPQRIKLALFGNLTARALLVRDSNRLVSQFVLQNPKLTEGEVVEFAKNANLDEDILRSIGNSGTWMKNYSIKVAIVSNPKVPVDVSLKWVNYILDKDLRKLSKSKNIPDVIASQCRKTLEKRSTVQGN